MKNCIIKNVFLFASMLTFSACSSSNKEKILSTYHENINSFIYVDETEVQEMQKNSLDYILFVYSDCGCSTSTENIIATFQEYIERTNLIIYAIGEDDYVELPTSLSQYFPIYPDLNQATKEMPSLYFYKKGNLIHQVKNNDDFLKVDKIQKIMDKYTYQNGMYSLNAITSYTHKDINFYKFDYEDTTLLNDVVSIDNSTVLYTWDQCGDCLAFKDVLRELYKNTYKTKLYSFEVSYFRNSTNKETLWDASDGFPYKYDFSSYLNGKVPTLITYKDGKKKDMYVFRNDIIENNIITTSFYEELIYKTMTQEEIDEYESQQILAYLRQIDEN